MIPGEHARQIEDFDPWAFGYEEDTLDELDAAAQNPEEVAKKDAEAVTQISSVETQLDLLKKDIAEENRTNADFNAVLNLNLPDLVSKYQDVSMELQLLKLMMGEEIKGADEQAQEREGVVEDHGLSEAEADKQSAKIFRKLCTKIHPDRGDRRFTGMFERASALRRRRDVHGLQEMAESVKNILKAGSYLLSRLQVLFKERDELQSQLQVLKLSSHSQMKTAWSTGVHDYRQKVLQWERDRREGIIQGMIEEIERLRAINAMRNAQPTTTK